LGGGEGSYGPGQSCFRRSARRNQEGAGTRELARRLLGEGGLEERSQETRREWRRRRLIDKCRLLSDGGGGCLLYHIGDLPLLLVMRASAKQTTRPPPGVFTLGLMLTNRFFRPAVRGPASPRRATQLYTTIAFLDTSQPGSPVSRVFPCGSPSLLPLTQQLCPPIRPWLEPSLSPTSHKSTPSSPLRPNHTHAPRHRLETPSANC